MPVEHVAVYQRLLSAREAVLSTQVKSDWLGSAIKVAAKLLSPVGMFKVLQDFWRNAPQGWYLKLVRLEQMVTNLGQSNRQQQIALIGEIQRLAMSESHWAFRYGLVGLWQQLLTVAGADETLRTQATQGSRKLLGQKHLKADSVGCCNGKQLWVSRHARAMTVVGDSALTLGGEAGPRRLSTSSLTLFSAVQAGIKQPRTLGKARRAVGAAVAFDHDAFKGARRASTMNPMYTGGK